VTSGSEQTAAQAIEPFFQIWKEAMVFVLGQISQAEWSAAPADAAATAAAESSWIVFFLAGALDGEIGFQVAHAQLVRMSQLLMSEPADPGVVFTPEHADAAKELFRQFAGRVATACKAKYGRETKVDLIEKSAPEWPLDCTGTWATRSSTGEPLRWNAFLNPALKKTLDSTAQPAAAQAPASPSPSAARDATAPVPQASPPSGDPPSGSPRNIDLLLDVELDAALRFGQREMLLRDILELRPGSVIELDRKVQEPAELLVAGRVIARGDVVIVDGNYGLRITHIAQPRDRLPSADD
jgi:flagellar motor switch protein FliN